jgi:sulfoxide reductase heme-binding subunit YedZ
MSSAVWYFSRATGLVSLVLLTGVVVLGALGAGRFATREWPGSPSPPCTGTSR